ncbi:cupin domain-containing protein [Bacillus sp. ISL-18]|uniref:cupin domain-containing protein n=1 Tax=Bacillus sp. ISL-18 TaxID=2819118 RepID=UPI001BEBEC5C|nr:cupin domain-containing protein [Bacillus sp. ISL-18]MBT2658412.1 cupin domain-containing protein [Bacillus sp. ISL-18]
MLMTIVKEEFKKRVIRFDELVADKAAFIDAKTPGSDKKENFTIIGPGVSESSNRVINLEEAHGFNFGAAAMPNGTKNSLHSHLTAEVFIVAKGTWRFFWGNDGKEGEAILKAGDVFSIPTKIFRAFENIGSDDGFLYCILGEDNPGKVTWAPQVLRAAEGYGLVLLEDGRLIDTTAGQEVPADAKVVKPISSAELALIPKISEEEMSKQIFRFQERVPHSESFLDCRIPGGEKKSYGLIGPGMAEAVDRSTLLSYKHSFNLELIEAEPGNGFKSFKLSNKQVVFVQKGEWKISLGEKGEEGEVVLTEKDIMSVPVDVYRQIECVGKDTGILFIINSGDDRPILEWAPEVINAAQKTGLQLDENNRLIK